MARRAAAGPGPSCRGPAGAGVAGRGPEGLRRLAPSPNSGSVRVRPCEAPSLMTTPEPKALHATVARILHTRSPGRDRSAIEARPDLVIYLRRVVERRGDLLLESFRSLI